MPEDPVKACAYPLSVLAESIGITPRAVAGWVEQGRVNTWQAPPGSTGRRGMHYCSWDEAQRLVAEGVPVDLDVLVAFALGDHPRRRNREERKQVLADDDSMTV